MNHSTQRIVIIGGVACGPKVAARARRLDPDAEIILVEKGRYLSYAGCGLPYFVGGSVPELDGLRRTTFGLLRDETYFKDVKNIDARTRTLAESIDRAAKTITIRDLETDQIEALPYDKLVIATGAVPVRPPIEGIDLDGVFSLHVPEDAEEIRRRIDAGEVDHAIIIGAGLIGLEMVESLFNHAVDAVVLEMADRILPTLLDPEMAELFTRELVRDGIEIYTGQRAQKLTGDEKVKTVVTQDREIKTDLVILAAGVRPNVELARSAGLKIGETGAIAVNEYLETSDPDIYAGGDCVECFDRVSGAWIYAPLGSTANLQGRIIGDNLAGGRESFPGVTGTAVMKSLNVNMAKTGLTERQAQEKGLDVVTSITPCMDHVHFYPGNKFFVMKLIAERKSGRLLGGQLVGQGDVIKRNDVLATALQFGATLQQVANLNLGYSPPFSHALDGVIHAANNTRNRIAEMARVYSPEEACLLFKENQSVIFLDVREPSELEKNSIDDPRTVSIPLSELRRRLEEIPDDKEIICICAQGLRGYEAALILQSSGFQKAAYLDGGMRMWPYVSSAG